VTSTGTTLVTGREQAGGTGRVSDESRPTGSAHFKPDGRHALAAERVAFPEARDGDRSESDHRR